MSVRYLLACALAAGLVSPPARVIAGEAEDPIRAEPLIPQVWRTFTTDNGLPDNRIRTVAFIDDDVWVGTRGGLAKLEGDSFRSWTVRDGLPHPDVTAVDIDHKTGDIWIGTWGGGVARLTAGRFDIFSQINSGLAGNLVFDVAVVGDRMWAATNAGVCEYNPNENTWELFLERRANQPQIVATDLCRSGDDLFASTWHEGLWRFDRTAREWVRVGPAASPGDRGPSPAGPAMSETAGLSGTGDVLWLAGQSNVARRGADGSGDRTWVRQPIAVRTRDAFVHGIAGGASTAWLATGAGLFALADWPSRTWLCIRKAGDDGGSVILVMRDGKPIDSLTPGTMIPDNRLRCVAVRDGDLWVGTVAGLAQGTKPVSLSELGTSGVTKGVVARRVSDPAPSDRYSTGTYARHRSKAPAGIAIFGPRSRTVAVPDAKPGQASRSGRADLLAVQLALEEMNARGGYRSKAPFDLITTSVGYSRYGWGTPEDDFATFAGYTNVLGIVGRAGPGDRIVDSVAAKTELPFVNVATQRSEAGPSVDNPWVFRCWGDEPRQHRQFLDYLIDVMGLKRIALVRTAGAEPLRHLDWWQSHAIQRGHRPVVELVWPADGDGVNAVLQALRDRAPDVILAWPDAATAAAVVRALRGAGLTQPFVAGRPIVSTEFVKGAGEEPGSVMALYATPRRADSPSLERFAERYGERNVVGGVPRKPDRRAYASRLAAEHLLTAIDEGGANLDAVLERLTVMGRSANGEAHYEKLHEPTTVIQAVLEEGRWSFRPAK